MNKIVLFLVEGSTDKRSIGLTLTRLLKAVKIHIIKTDLTSDKNNTVDNIESAIFEHIGFFLAEQPQFSYDDISCVIQLTDTDGAFIDNSAIIQDDSCDIFTYDDAHIRAKSIESVVERNERKSGIIRYLSTKKEIRAVLPTGKEVTLPFRIYYMSCNLEHVLHDIRNNTEDKKVSLSEEFQMKAGENTHLLRDLVSNPSIFNSTSYEESWNYIQQGTNSLKRKSNFEYFFLEFVDHQ